MSDLRNVFAFPPFYFMRGRGPRSAPASTLRVSRTGVSYFEEEDPSHAIEAFEHAGARDQLLKQFRHGERTSLFFF